MKKYLQRIVLTMAICAFGSMGMQAEKLVILHTNDTHSQIDPAADGMGGVARRKVVIDSVRTAEKNVVVADAGDIVQGTLYFNIYKGEVEEKVMNALGYDLRILGNHEFDNGMEALAANLKDAQAKMLASNYQMRGTPLEGIFQPYDIREISGKRIAFLPVNLDPKGMISDSNYTGMGYIDAIEAANRMAWYLKNIEQADYVVALTHIGYISSKQPDDKELAGASRDIDVIIGGHSHTLIEPGSEESTVANADGRNVLVAQTGRYGKYVGQITIDLDSLGNFPEYRLISIDSRLDSSVDPAMEELLAPYRAAVDELNSKVVAKTKREMVREKDGLLNFFADFTAARGRQLAGDVDFAIINKGGLRHDLPKGNITEGEVITLMPFFNRLQVIDIKGDKLAENFDIMARQGGQGVSREVEAVMDSQTNTCKAILINGKPLDPERTYRIATNDYLAKGGDYMTPLTEHSLVAESPVYFFDDLLDYLRGPYKGKTIDAPDTPRMHY